MKKREFINKSLTLVSSLFISPLFKRFFTIEKGISTQSNGCEINKAFGHSISHSEFKLSDKDLNYNKSIKINIS